MTTIQNPVDCQTPGKTANYATEMLVIPRPWESRLASVRPCEDGRRATMAKKSTVRSIGILTGGGDCQALNAAIRAVAKCVIGRHGIEVVGFLDGFRGLVENRTVRLDDSQLSGASESLVGSEYICVRPLLRWSRPPAMNMTNN